jgi:RNA polymerase subunit RPABC4/transcription elongation factor Spt4
MGNFICNNCKSEIAEGKMSICPNCGTFVCNNCSDSNGSLCPYCFEQLHKIN